ncbi:phosphoadenosine phosphosulfate reductase family protein [uncultured Muriicola sp.]|uniref:phosphoadenosine phosphosulfate reductase domain-containing protein n=1 Tax=uncultured Muriicola sp. TaxID=1583102 RepID=UPI00260A2929|nr:phosphoadenosine phosphosulfate reductase family protein [uncultured Muriicola sp.]
MKFTDQHLEHLNAQFRGIPTEEIIGWALDYARSPIVTTNFGPFSASILRAVTAVKKDVPVIWCDTGYNTEATYTHADEVMKSLDLNMKIYVPKQTRARRDVLMGIPDIDDPRHTEFTRQVKLEPFRRAIKEHQPDVWFTNIRKGQTAFRDSLDMLSISKEGILKVSPFYHWNDAQLKAYLRQHQLPNEQNYYDPTKVLQNRECGIHL